MGWCPTAAIVRMAASVGPMQGVQPMAKTEPSGEAAEHAAMACAGSPATEAFERLPRAGQAAEAQHAHEVEPEDDEHDAADLAQQRQVLTQWSRDDVGGDAKHGEDEREAEHEGDGIGHRPPAGQRGGALETPGAIGTTAERDRGAAAGSPRATSPGVPAGRGLAVAMMPSWPR